MSEISNAPFQHAVDTHHSVVITYDVPYWRCEEKGCSWVDPILMMKVERD